MSIKGGSIEFDIIANNGQINGSLKETERRITGFSKNTVSAGDRINQMFDATNENIAVQKRVIQDLEAQYKKLQAEITKVAPGKWQAELMHEAGAIKAELDQEVTALMQLETAVKKNETAHVNLRTQLRNAVQQLAEMEQTGQRGTKAYSDLQKECGRLTDAMGDAQMQAKLLAHDNAGLQGVISAVSGVTGAFSAAQGAVGLFAGENENLQKIMLKVQSLMSITMGLQQAANTLNKDSYFSLVILTKAKQTFSAATLFAGKALIKFGVSANVARVAATALTATLTLGLSVAITAAVTAINKIIEKQKENNKSLEEAKKAFDDYRKNIASNAANMVGSYQKLRNEYKNLETEAKKTSWIKKNASEFAKLELSVTSVADADNVFITKSAEVVKALELRAKAMALQNIQMKAYEDYYNKIITGEEQVTEVKKGDNYKLGVGEAMVGKKPKEMEAAGVTDQEYNAMFNWTGGQSGQGSVLLSKEVADKINAYRVAKANEANKQIREEAGEELEKTLTLAKEQLQKTEGEISGLKVLSDSNGTPEDTKTSEDPFLEQLNERKKAYEQYFKWVNSKDTILQQAAKTEFSGILAEGSNYLDYLTNQRAALISAIGDRAGTKEQQDNLRALNNAIAGETKNTVLAEFDTVLQEQLAGANSIFDKLAVLEEKRKELSGDGSDLDAGKQIIVEEAQQDILAQAQQQTQQLLQEYSGYLSEKLEFEASYAEKSRLLNEAIAKAKTDDERAVAEAALKALNEKKEQYSVTPEQIDYEDLKSEYKSYKQQIADISADYDAKIALATKNQNSELVAELTEAKNKALSSAALQELQDSGAWSQLFGNLDDLTMAQITDLITKIEAQQAQLGVELSPEDLQAVLDKLKAAKDEVETRNPFKALSLALKDYKKEANKANLSEVLGSLSSSIDLVKGAFDTVTGALANMGLAGDDVTQDLLGDIGNMVGAAGQLASGIATGNPLSIIQGSISLLTSAFEVFNVKDRKAERSIKKHAAAVKGLEKQYTALEHAVDQALGESVYDNQKALISNMREQQLHLQEMWKAEESKKKADGDKVDEYKEQYEELGRQIKGVMAEISQNITQTSAKDLASQLADAIAETFTDGFNSAKVNQAIEKVVKQVMQNAVKNALKLQFLEGPLQGAIAQLQKDMGFDKEENGSFNGLSKDEQNAFKERIKGIAANYTEALKMYEKLFKDLEEGTGDPTSSLSGAIKGASQESIDLLAGQTNAVRVNQVVSIDLLRQQLLHLASIDTKVGVSNDLLGQIYNEVKGYSASDPLRSKGITQ